MPSAGVSPYSQDTMADSYWTGTTTGTQDTYTVPFPYLDSSHVKVSVNGVPQLVPGDYQWLTAGSIKFNKAPTGNLPILIARKTSPDNSLVTYNNGAVLTASDLNTAALQNFYRTQELQDALDQYISGGLASYAGMGALSGLSPSELITQVSNSVLSSALYASLNAALTDISANAQSILQQTNRVDTLQSTVDALTNPVLNGLATYLSNETNARITGDTALASTISLIGAQSSSSTAFILNASNVYVDPTTSMADRFVGLDSRIASNLAAITSESTTRASADSALATTVSNLSATVNSNYGTLNAAIGSEQTARASGDSANASSISALQATVTNNYNSLSASITNEQTVRASADSTNASAISSLSTTVNGNTASIQSQATSINGLSAQYTVKVDVNGRVAGFGLASTSVNGVPTSDFIVLANRFAVVDPGAPGSTPKVPFVVTGGVVYMQNVVINGALIQDATILNAKIGDLQVTTAKIADQTVTTAKIANLAVTNAQIANATITNAQIANATITYAQIADATITSAKIANAAIGSAQIGNLQVTSAHIADLTVGTSKIANDAVTGSATATAANGNISFNYTSAGGMLVIQCRSTLSVNGNGSLGNANLVVDGTTYDTVAGVGGSFGTTTNVRFNGFVALPLAAGTHAVTINTSGQGGSLSNSILVLVEYKR